jgi:DNA phosphorothioation-dependent restriction protein DptG
MSDKKGYDKMPDYIESLFHVFKSINQKANALEDKRTKMIGLMVYNYINKLAKDNNVDLKTIKDNETINLIPVFEYISHNNIELYDFTKIEVADVDITKREDLERFILTHVYYITQK